MEDLPHLPDTERLSPNVIRILGGNPSKYTLQGTNTYLIGTSSRRILLDTGEGKATWSESLRQTLSDENASVEKILLTHWHPDHVGGVSDALKLPGCENAEIYKCQLDAGTAHIADGQKQAYSPLANQLDIHHNQTFTTEGATLTAFHCPGHTVDHMAFVLSSPETGEDQALFSGDNVLGHGTAVFEDLAAYMTSLQKMHDRLSASSTPTIPIFPGHGAVIDNGRAKIAEYISHRQERERQILDVLKEVSPDGEDQGWSSMGIVKVVYAEYPEHLHGPAEGSVVHVLRKMEGDGRVVRAKGEGGGWRLSSKAAL